MFLPKALSTGFLYENAKTTLAYQRSPAFVATIKLLTASKPNLGLWSLPLSDK